MKKIPREIDSYVSSIQRIEFIDTVCFITSLDGVYLYLDFPADSSIYSYLDRISFSSFFSLLNSFSDSYQLFYLGEDYTSTDFLPILFSLYSKSVQEVLWEPDQFQRMVQKIQFQYNDLLKYYYDLQDWIEEMYFPRESYYHLLLSISSIYHFIRLGSSFLDKFLHCDSSSYREVLTVHNLQRMNCLNHKILDFSSSRRDNYIFEIANYYQMNYKREDVLSLIESYFDHFSVRKDEKYLFYSLISILWKTDGENLEDVLDLLFYVKQTNLYLLEKNKEDQESK